MNNIINILGVNISLLKKRKIIGKIKEFLADGKQHQIVTPNPEFILQARKDEEFFYILNSADLAVPDGIGLKFAAWAMGKNLHRFTGADLVKEILKIAEERGLRVGVVNWSGALSKKEDIENVLKQKYPKLKFLVVNADKEAKLPIGSLASSSDFQPDILFCSFGAPYQEKFIYHALAPACPAGRPGPSPAPAASRKRGAVKNLPSVKIAIGVGGAFDFLTGKIKRAPKIFRILGLEWLWRLILEPRYRFKRIYNAVIVFPLLFIKWRFILPFLYRPNVACMAYKKEGNEFKILLVERKVRKNHWQLPQGGMDGESVERAGERELKEELGTDKFKIIKTYKNIYFYKFTEELSKFKVASKSVWGCKGQKQSLCIAEFLGSDNDIKINFWEHKNWKWVSVENLINEVHPVRREAAEIFMEKFKNAVK